MSLYAVKNDKGEWLNVVGRDGLWGANGTGIATKEQAEARSELFGGTVVELVENPAPIVVSEEEAEILQQAKCDDDPAELIVGFVNSHDKYDDDSNAEARLMRAYVIGWTVEKPKRWNVKVPHTTDELYWKRGNGNIGCVGAWQNDDEIVRNRAFTLAEIEHYGLGDCQKVVCAGSARTTGEDD